jgi:hypothetical protein
VSLISMARTETPKNLLANPGFEKTVVEKNDALLPANWDCCRQSCWYEMPKGNGMSKVTLDAQVAHGGNFSLRIDGDDNRGIVIQHLRNCLPGRKYKIEGWIRTQKLEGAEAVLKLEYVADQNQKFLGGTTIGKIKETAEWTRVGGIVVIPAECKKVLVEVLTTSPNRGTAWFDDISLIKTDYFVVDIPSEYGSVFFPMNGSTSVFMRCFPMQPANVRH